MPVAAAAKARRATYHSHTTDVEQRDDYKMARQQVPGFALVISTGDPAFRFERSRPGRTGGLADSMKSRKQDAATWGAAEID
jgi:hypothetical protein